VQSKVRVLSTLFAIVVFVVLASATGCDRLRRTPEPILTATPTRVSPPALTPAATPVETPVGGIPLEILSARDAALVFLRNQYPARAPVDGVAWIARNTTPPGVVGIPSYEFASDSWLMTVAALPISSANIIYETGLENPQAGLRWTGRLDASYSLLESNLNLAVEVPAVRDLVLAYVRQYHSAQAPAENVVWIGERTTPYGLVGHETCQFTASAAGWRMTVDYALVAPAQVVYKVDLSQTDTGFVWRGQVDGEGAVFEHR
jgi:hypothetical protein